ERRDEADVRAFGRLDRADAAVVRDVDVAHLERGALPVEAARAEGRQTALVRQLRERVRLVDDLRELASAEEVVDRARDRLRVDDQARRQVLLLEERHALLDGPLELEEALAKLVAGELVDRADAAVAEVVDVVE